MEKDLRGSFGELLPKLLGFCPALTSVRIMRPRSVQQPEPESTCLPVFSLDLKNCKSDAAFVCIGQSVKTALLPNP